MDHIKLVSGTGRMIIGELLNFEGEVMDVTINSPDMYSVGDSLSCNYNGIKFNSLILNKINNRLLLYCPLFQTDFPNERRKIPRIEVNIPAIINDFISEKVYQVPPDKKVEIVDLSMRGFGIISTEAYKINTLHYLYFTIDNVAIKTKIMIKNEKLCDNGFRYGSEIQANTKTDFEILRNYVLTYQLKKIGVLTYS